MTPMTPRTDTLFANICLAVSIGYIYLFPLYHPTGLMSLQPLRVIIVHAIAGMEIIRV